MNFVVLFVTLTFAVGGFAAQKPIRKGPSCQDVLDSPLSSFFEELETHRRKRTPREELDHFLYHAEYMQTIASSIQATFARQLLDPEFKAKSARGLLDKLLREDLRAWAHQPLPKPIAGSVADLETHFDPERIARVPLEDFMFEDVMSGARTVVVLAHNQWDIKSGSGELVVERTGEVIPVRIERVEHHFRYFDFSEKMMRAQGLQLTQVLSEKGLVAAVERLLSSLQSKNPNLDPIDANFTVVTFKRKLH